MSSTNTDQSSLSSAGFDKEFHVKLCTVIAKTFLRNGKRKRRSSGRSKSEAGLEFVPKHTSDPKALIHESVIKGDLSLLTNIVSKHILRENASRRGSVVLEDTKAPPFGLERSIKSKGQTGGTLRAQRKRGGTETMPQTPKELEEFAKELTDILNGVHPNQTNGKEAIPLIEAAFYNQKECVQYLIKFGASINLQDEEGSTAVSHAFWNGNSDICNMLIEAKADLTLKDSEGNTPLHKAAYGGHKSLVDLLLKTHKVEVNSTDDSGSTPLILAALNGCHKVITTLINRKADPMLADNSGFTALHHAAQTSNEKCVLALVTNLQASPEDKKKFINIKDSSGLTALNLSCEQKNLPITKLLLEHGADPCDMDSTNPLNNAAFAGSYEIVELLLEHKASVNANSKTTSPLHTASFKGSDDILKLLLAAKANKDHKDEEGATPLHKACFKSNDKCAQILIESNADINVPDSAGNSPAHVASYVGSLICLEALIKQDNCNINALNALDQTPLFHCANRGHLSCLQTLMQAKATVNHADKQRNTALIFAVIGGQRPCVKELLFRGADFDAANAHGVSALHVAVAHPECLSSLLKFHPKIDVPDAMGRTPLFYAVKSNNEQSARLLIFKGASIDITDKKGKPLVKVSTLLNKSVLKQIEKEKSEQLDKHTLKEFKLVAKAFNEKPSKGIQILQQQKASASQVAKFLHNAEGLKKDLIGDYLGENDTFAADVRREFVAYFDFTGFEFDHAARYFLSKFRLPGEAQKIDRIMEEFSKRYHANNPKVFSHPDTAYLLAFSVIMLNTDLHNPSIKKEKKMTIEGFLKNNKGIDQGKDVPKEFLKKIYNNIKKDQIQMDATASLYHNAEKKGWMQKRGGRIKTWKRRWFVLNDNCLFYFKSQKDKQPLGIIPLENLAVRVSTEKKGKKNMFELYQKDSTVEMKAMKITSKGSVTKGHHDIYLFSADTPQDRDDWIQCTEGNIFKNPFLELTLKKLKTQSGKRRATVRSGPAFPEKKTGNVKINFKNVQDLATMCKDAVDLDKEALIKKYGEYTRQNDLGHCRYFLTVNNDTKKQFVVVSSKIWSDLSKFEKEHKVWTEKLGESKNNNTNRNSSNDLYVEPPKYYKFHQVVKEIMKDVKGLFKSDYTTLITGWSLYSAIAYSLSKRLRESEFEIGKLITFGQPLTSTEHRPEETPKDLTWLRVMLWNDPVAALFPHHAEYGLEILLLSDRYHTNRENDGPRELKALDYEVHNLDMYLSNLKLKAKTATLVAFEEKDTFIE